jgi:hypothetical protein
MTQPVTTPHPDRLAAIAAGTIVPAVIHPEVGAEDPVLEVADFSLWYGAKRVLHDVSLAVPRVSPRSSAPRAAARVRCCAGSTA